MCKPKWKPAIQVWSHYLSQWSQLCWNIYPPSWWCYCNHRLRGLKCKMVICVLNYPQQVWSQTWTKKLPNVRDTNEWLPATVFAFCIHLKIRMMSRCCPLSRSNTSSLSKCLFLLCSMLMRIGSFESLEKITKLLWCLPCMYCYINTAPKLEHHSLSPKNLRWPKLVKNEELK